MHATHQSIIYVNNLQIMATFPSFIGRSNAGEYVTAHYPFVHSYILKATHSFMFQL